MKLRVLVTVAILLFLLFPTASFAQYYGESFGRFKMEDIQSRILDDFENNERNWMVSADPIRMSLEGFPSIKFGIEGAPIALAGVSNMQTDNRYVMGVRSAFNRKGYNRISIYPQEEIIIPGRAKKIDVWVWGANYYYNLEVHIRDYRGIVHVLPLGSLHFIGWRNMSVDIPKQIPQIMRYLPMEKPLAFVRFVIWTQPTERVDDYIIYFDHLKVLTDMYKERFDGDILADTSREIWSSQ